MSTFATVVGWVVAFAAVLGAAFVVSFRTRFAPALRLVRRMNRRVANPRQLRTAGQPGAYASVVEHRGRRSGATYRTPVVIEGPGDPLVVVLPYGPDADWVRNVLAAGGATVHHDGRVLAVERPAVVPIGEVRQHLPVDGAFTQRLFGVREALVLHPAAP